MAPIYNAVRRQLGQLAELNEADELLNVKLEKLCLLTTLNNLKTEKLLPVLLDQQAVYVRCVVNKLLGEGLDKLLFFHHKSLYFCYRLQFVDSLFLKLDLLMRVLNLGRVPANKRLIHDILVGEMRHHLTFWTVVRPH